MPIISKFFGIIVIMYWKDHNPPHIQVKYNQYHAIINIDDFKVMGKFPGRALNLVREWLKLHQLELLENWRRAASGEPIQSIAPLE